MRRRPLPRKNPVLHPARPEALVRESPSWTRLGMEHPPRGSRPVLDAACMLAILVGPLRCTETHRNSRTDRSQVSLAAFAAKLQNKTWWSGKTRSDVSDAVAQWVDPSTWLRGGDRRPTDSEQGAVEYDQCNA